jgi:hypothetical protein
MQHSQSVIASTLETLQPAPGARTFRRYALHATVLYGGEQDAFNYQEKSTDTREEPHLDGYEFIFTSRQLSGEEIAAVNGLLAEYPHELDLLRREANARAVAANRVTI